MFSSFNRLPLEVWIIILRYAPDLSTIYKFICASANANTAFNIDSSYILDAAIERSIPEFKHEARIVAIIGTLLTSSNFTLESLIHRYKNLPKEVLFTAPAYCAFMNGTPGPRYLVLTAYRIETLQHICFVSLLHNIHEALWPILPNTETHNYSIKNSKAGIDFQAVAWWSLSRVEKTRIMRAYWNLIIYWNIQEICPDLTTDDYDFSKYRATIKRIDPYFRPYSFKRFSTNPVEEMKCVLGATRDFLSFPHDSRLFTPFTSRQSSKFGLEKWVFATVFEENPCWRFEERKQIGARRVGFHLIACLKRRDKLPKDFSSGHSKPKLGDDDQFIDYLGICIWDDQRLSWVALGSGFYLRSSQIRAWTLAQNRAWTRSKAVLMDGRERLIDVGLKQTCGEIH
ncbi:hypothetical protein BGW36DRAFT_369468 [Talaromyces proteolyticus]|uniref:Uncharacterized protein n=1 Tax=Talaromyces proteolyticus TaxID=1131652 RepID=A0AAD4KXT1_9EURO|nr:uncharacterized protein BGW36DRAFT_369468 [Talaromyces proteolyticus]KAH8703526.1 hypothetical protein BGW36DRAFT_369468 [Talaromyces proteolyticus]